MLLMDELDPMRLYSSKRRVYAPFDPGNKKKGAAIMLLTQNSVDSHTLMNMPYIYNPKLFEALYIDRNIDALIDSGGIIDEDPDEAVNEAMQHIEKSKDIDVKIDCHTDYVNDLRLMKDVYKEKRFLKWYNYFNAKTRQICRTTTVIGYPDTKSLAGDFIKKSLEKDKGIITNSYSTEYEIAVVVPSGYKDIQKDEGDKWENYAENELITYVILRTCKNCSRYLAGQVAAILSGQFGEKEAKKVVDDSTIWEEDQGKAALYTLYKYYKKEGQRGIVRLCKSGDLSLLANFAGRRFIRNIFNLYESKLSAEERKNLKPSDYGLPSKKKYPMPDEEHVRAAIRYFNHVDPEDEEELANNIKKKIKKFDMDVEVGENNRFSKYYNESAINEGIVLNTKDIESNISKWGDSPHNVLYICGLSGSGKSTDARKIAQENDAILVELDIIERAYNFALKDKEFNRYDMQVISRYWKENGLKKDPQSMKDDDEYLKYWYGVWDYMLKDMHSQDKLFVVEGVQMIRVCKDHNPELINEPFIIKGTSLLTSIDRRIKREGIKSALVGSAGGLKGVIGRLNWYFDQENSLGCLRKAVSETKDESTILDESYLFSKDDIYINFDKWDVANDTVLFITGLSGSGKSTLARELATKYDAEYIELDKLIGAMFREDGLRDIQKGIGMSHILSEYWNSYSTHYKCTGFGDKASKKELLRFIKYVDDNHRNEGLIVIEGCDIFANLDVDYLIGKPLIIKGTSTATAYIRKGKRAYNKDRNNGKSRIDAYIHGLKVISKSLPYAMRNQKLIDQFEKEIKAANTIIEESAGFEEHSNEADIALKADLIDLIDSLSEKERNDIAFNGEYDPDFHAITHRFTQRDDEGKLSGFLDLYHYSSKPFQSAITLAVSPNHRRQGVAQKLVYDLLNSPPDKDVNRYIWHVDPMNTASVNLAKKCGFVKNGQTRYRKDLGIWEDEYEYNIPFKEQVYNEDIVHDYWYHLVPKNTNMSLGILSLRYMLDHGMNDEFNKYTDKYRDRICNGWDYYDKNPEDLTNDEIVNSLIRYRGKYGDRYIYLFKFPPYTSLGKNMKNILNGKDLYRVDLAKIPKNEILEIDYGHEGSNSDNPALSKDYYDSISPSDYFSNYDDNNSMAFSTINHIAIATRSGRIDKKYIEKIDIPNEVITEKVFTYNKNIDHIPLPTLNALNEGFVTEDNYICNDDFFMSEGFITFFNGMDTQVISEAEKKYDNKLKKWLFKERLKNNKMVLMRYEEMKIMNPWIRRTFLKLSMYRKLNIFIDLSYYHALFLKHLTYKRDLAIKMYWDFLNRLLNDSEYKSNYKKITIYLPVWPEAWNVSTVEDLIDYKKSINPISLIFRMVRKNPDELKKWGNKDILFVGTTGYFKINFNNLKLRDTNKLKRFLTKLFNKEDIKDDIEDDGYGEITKDTDSTAAITTAVIDRIERKTGIKIDDITGGNTNSEQPVDARVLQQSGSSYTHLRIRNGQITLPSKGLDIDRRDDTRPIELQDKKEVYGVKNGILIMSPTETDAVETFITSTLTRNRLFMTKGYYKP